MKKQDMINELTSRGVQADMSMSKVQLEEMMANTQAEVQTQDEEFEAYVSSFVRANRVTVTVTEQGYVARFFRTHRLVGEIPVALQKSEDGKVTHSNEAREIARNFAISQCPSYEIEWAPEYQAQAWERKYQKYATDEQVAEDASTLMDMALTGVADKLGYDWDIRFDGIYAKQTSLGYIEDGKYAKDGCWAWADIVMTVILTKDGISTELPMQMEMVSGQIKKCKLNQTSLKAMIQTEQELQTA